MGTSQDKKEDQGLPWYSEQRAKAAAVIDDLLNQTDARMTLGAHFGKYSD